MKVTFHAEGITVKCAENIEEEKKVCDLIDMLQLDLDVFPQKGQRLCFSVDIYTIDAEVDYSYINFREPGNKHLKQSSWGVSYDVYRDNLEIVDCFV